jgi:hypothetical protein
MKKWLFGRHRSVALLSMIAAQAPSVVHTARPEVDAPTASSVEDTTRPEEVAPTERLKILSFNLEGRGGNQADGGAVRQQLRDYFVQLCSDSDRPQVIITQEDTGANLPGDCYEEVMECKSERFWFTNDYRFGDGAKKTLQAALGKELLREGSKAQITAVSAADSGGMGAKMQNKIYVLSDLVSTKKIIRKKLWKVDLVDAGMLLEEDEAGTVTKPGLNPRCAALAQLEIDGQSFTIGSFHLSGGYVDDEQAIDKVNDANEQRKFESIRQEQLTKILSSLPAGTPVDNQVIIGGDTNGFPSDQVDSCQGGRIDYLRKDKRFLREGADASFKKYVTTPDVIGDDLARRVDETIMLLSGGQQSSTQSRGRGADVCSSWMASTTVWGGQPDQFFTKANVQDAQAQVIPVGIQDTEAHKPRFGKTLSDHNPVLFSCGLNPGH